jgi:YHYH protein
MIQGTRAMRNGITTLAVALACAGTAAAVPPIVTQWKMNTTGATGYGGTVADVTLVRYSGTNVYVTCQGIPSYSIGPWNTSPNTPTGQGWVYKLPLSPVQNTGAQTTVGLGHVGVLRDGTGVYNSRDAMSYNNLGVWNRIAWYFERTSFDSCNGHPSPGREWHPHVIPVCLLGANDPTQHSPLIGFAFDGFPIYGPFGYANADGTGGVVRISSGFRTRSISARTTLPDGTALSPSQYGPAIGGSYPLGCFVEDWEFVVGQGLDTHNGRFCVTPEFPSGTYCYFVTVDATNTPVYPYILGTTYYGVVPAGNTGPGGGHNTPGTGETVTTLTGGNCPADIDGSRTVDGADLGVLLANWGRGGGGDLNRDGVVDGADLGALLSAWGPCQ